MIQFTVHAAKTQLSRLIDAALAGEEVVIARRPRRRAAARPSSPAIRSSTDAVCPGSGEASPQPGHELRPQVRGGGAGAAQRSRNARLK